MPFRSYKKLLSFLFAQLPMYQRVGAQAFKKDLNNIKKLALHLNAPHLKFPSVHIAGTNGKGSVTHLMASALVAKGLQVGVYTSPHYFDFRERIKIGADFISEKEVLDFVNQNIDVIDEIKPSFFEITVAMAFDHFARHRVDIAIIETGLGGRLDSTNIIKPVLSVITNISFDHQAMLGNTLVQIAKEKAGIIKQDVPVVIGEYQKEVAVVFKKKASQRNAPISFASRKSSLNFVRKSIKDAPEYMTKNRVTAYAALLALGKEDSRFNLIEKKILKAFDEVHKNVFYIGRWQQLSDRPKIFLDSAHNEAGLRELLNHIYSIRYNKLHIVLGFVEDKDHKKVLGLLPREAKYYFAKAKIPRGLNAEELQEKAKAFKLMGKVYSSVSGAFNGAKRRAERNDLVLVMGSIFLIAEIKDANTVLR